MSTTSPEAPEKKSPPAKPAPSGNAPQVPPLVPLRERLLQSNKARTQGAGTGEDRDLTPEMKKRRGFVWLVTFGVLGASVPAVVRFFFPRALFEPKTRFSVGYPTDFAMGVDTRFQQAHRIWVVRDAQGIFVLYARCTHLGCTPDWKETDNKFKCPCHGSGFDMEGVNFEGPAPRPLDRCLVEVDPQGRLIVDTAVLFPYETWNDPRARLTA